MLSKTKQTRTNSGTQSQKENSQQYFNRNQRRVIDIDKEDNNAHHHRHEIPILNMFTQNQQKVCH